MTPSRSLDPSFDPTSAPGVATLDPGYVEQEFLVQGAASTYSGVVTGPAVVEQTNVPYATRVLVRYPKDASKFSGRVVVEPFNTSGQGKDADVVWSVMAPMLQKRGDAWVGVTERTSAGEALKQADATRYADVNVPSNDVAWDVLAQVGLTFGPSSRRHGLLEHTDGTFIVLSSCVHQVGVRESEVGIQGIAGVVGPTRLDQGKNVLFVEPGALVGLVGIPCLVDSAFVEQDCDELAGI